MLPQGRRCQRVLLSKILRYRGVELSNENPTGARSWQCYFATLFLSGIASRYFWVTCNMYISLSLSFQSQGLGIRGYADQETAKSMSLLNTLDLQ